MKKEDLKILKDIVKMIECQDPISINSIMNEMSIGFNRAKRYLSELAELKIVTLEPRKMIVSYSKAINILNKLGDNMGNFENIIGYESIKVELERIIDCINNREKYEKLGVKIPKNLLLHGDPGVGKTLFANAFINALNRNKYIIRKDMPDGKFVEFIKSTVKEAIANQPAVILLDDLCHFSNNDDDHPNSEEFTVVQALCDEASNDDVYFVATANDITAMPTSLLRPGRFSNKIEIHNPSLKDAKLIIEHYLSDKCISDDIDYDEVAKILDGGTCALLEDVINEAGLIAGFNGHTVICMEDIVKACLKVIYNSPENLEERTQYRLTTAAYHEAGHAIVAELLDNYSVNLVSVANYYSGIGGITSDTKNENYWYDFSKMENRVITLLAGRAAIEVMEHKLDVGCNSDLTRARSIIDRFYNNYGANNLKHVSIDPSDESKREYDMWINQKMNEYYNKAKEILIANKLKLVDLTSLLIEKKTLVGKDVRDVLYFNFEQVAKDEKELNIE